MTIEQLRKAYEAQPFVPFAFPLPDGRFLRVPSREFLAFNPGGRTVIVVQPDESWNVVDLLLVSDLEFLPSSRKRSNGR